MGRQKTVPSDMSFLKLAFPEKAVKEELSADSSKIAAAMRKQLIGQEHAVRLICQRLEIYETGLAEEGRPAGVFLMTGPTGVGKTKTVQVLADVLHGSARNALIFDCAEFRLPHEIARLTGAPPGYLGHRETQPMLSQSRLNAVTSERSGLSIVLFDEIEKGDRALHDLLLGIMDRGSMRAGDGTVANFERTLIFMTSNVGSKEIADSLRPGYGYGGVNSGKRQGRAARAALHRTFRPEFLNRLDEILEYQPLTRDEVGRVLELELRSVQERLIRRMSNAPLLSLDEGAWEFLLEKGYSPEHGARELKRAIQRYIVLPLVEVVSRLGKVGQGGVLEFTVSEGKEELSVRRVEGKSVEEGVKKRKAGA